MTTTHSVPGLPTEQPRQTPEAVFILGTITLQHGGRTRATLARLRLFANTGLRVRLLLTGYRAREEEHEAAVRAAWELPDTVEIRYFWREAAPNGGGSDTDARTHARDEDGLSAFTTADKHGESIGFYDNGVLCKTKRFDDRGRLYRTDHHDHARRVVARESFDPRGRLVRTDSVNPENGHATLRRWFDRHGACWLTNWLEGEPAIARTTVRHLPEPAAYNEFEECVAGWVDDVLAASTQPVVFSDSRRTDLLLLALHHPGVRTIAMLHNDHTRAPHGPSSPTKASWLPLLTRMREFDAVVALTHRQREHLAEQYGGEKLTVINHPAPHPPATKASHTDGLLVAVARLEPQKRLEHAIEAFAIAARQVPEARFDIYGSGSKGTALKSLVRERGLDGRVNFRGFAEHPFEAFASGSASVLSSQYEGFGMVLTESMGVGTPMVSYDVNYGPAEVIRHEVDGLVVPDGDIDALANAMVSVLSDPGYAATLGQRAREVTARFSTDRWAREWTELFGLLTNTTVEPAHEPARSSTAST